MPIHDILVKTAKAGLLGVCLGSPWHQQYSGSNVAGGISPEQVDQFHYLILMDEFSRASCGGGGFLAGLTIGLPPILNFASPSIKEKVCTSCLRGEKVICLAITEPGAGSDVASITCEAKKTADGKHYIVNGEKKWITNGIYADYFTTAVRTGGSGMGGVSVLLIERGPGVTTRQMSCSGLWSSGTTYVTYENVLVPVENLIGEENQGFKIIMHNFNHERMGVIIEANRLARTCYEESFKYALKRKTFGKTLMEHAVIREKLAHMIRQVESTQSIIESVIYQMNKMSHDEASLKLGGITAILKSQATLTLEYCSREAGQIFGGLSFTRGGQGGKIEHIHRQTRAFTIFAGSEEIMLDLGVRMAVRQFLKSKM
eukprot:TRINITY_DN293_c0_g3_i2.p1 TRINITY_DN293_c0_g3~~TRINITY_DN293_c0_g3_i2.p1  ORF type:complete len:372 (-),score=85.07 TRINITY_DN293_c0_g3_i2:199-1314(-)